MRAFDCRHNGPRPALRVLVLAAAALAGALAHPARAAAVSVTPNALYIDSRTRSAALTLLNQSERPEEVELSFAFGYPTSDAEGRITVQLMEQAPPGEPSVVGWMRAFPRRLVLQPGEKQVVRILVQPPTGLADGEYWGRVVIRSRGGTPPVEQVQGDLRFQLQMETVLVTAVNYRSGATSSAVSVRGAEARVVEAGGVRLLLDLERSGNAAYLGQVSARIVAPDGRTVAEASEPVAVYYRLRMGMVITAPVGGVPPGSRMEYRVEAIRPDLPSEAVLPSAPVAGTVDLLP